MVSNEMASATLDEAGFVSCMNKFHLHAEHTYALLGHLLSQGQRFINVRKDDCGCVPSHAFGWDLPVWGDAEGCFCKDWVALQFHFQVIC
jgi:hypothetical protein